MRFIKSALLALLLAAGACANNPAPEPLPPMIRPVAIRTCVAGAQVTVDGALNEPAQTYTADAHGDVAIDIFGVAFNLHVRAAGYPPYDQVVVFSPPFGGKQLLLNTCVPVTDPDWQMVLPRWDPLFVDTGERGAVRVEGTRFVREDGSTFPWRGTDAFLLYEHWLREGTDIDPVVQDWLTCGGLCVGRGPNVLRVLGMVTWGNLYPQQHADYYEQLAPFVDHLWTVFHVRVEFVIFADAQIIMPDRSQEEAHAGLVLHSLAGRPNVFFEVANEPFQNIPGGGQAAYEIGLQLRGHGFPVASGDYNDPGATRLDYITLHTDRGPEWVRKAKDLLDYRDMFDRPIVGDEPIGTAEVDIPGRRTNDVEAWAQFGALCQIFSAGCTFHNDAGTDHYGPLGPKQAAAGAGFFQGMHFVPVDAQFSQYQRGAAEGGPGIGNMPLEHSDELSMRTFCKALGGNEYCVAVQPQPAWRAVARDGWIVVEEPRRGLVRLTR